MDLREGDDVQEQPSEAEQTPQHEQAGAVAALISNDAGDEVILMGGTEPAIAIPSMFIGQSHGEMLAAELGNGLNVRLSAEVQRDGDLDNGIIAHEYGHGVSIRLTGGPSNVGCLSLAQSRSNGSVPRLTSFR